MNKLFLSGRISKDIELRKTESGIDLVYTSIAINKKDGVEYFDITVFGQSANYLYKYAKKGDFIEVFAHLQNRQIEKKGKKTYKLSIIADSLSIVSNRKKDGIEFRKIEEIENLESEEE